MPSRAGYLIKQNSYFIWIFITHEGGTQVSALSVESEERALSPGAKVPGACDVGATNWTQVSGGAEKPLTTDSPLNPTK